MAKLFEVTFYKKFRYGEIETVQNIFAKCEEDAVGLLIDLDNNRNLEQDEFLGIEELEYNIKEI